MTGEEEGKGEKIEEKGEVERGRGREGAREEGRGGGTGGGGEYEENSGRTKKTHSETWLLVTSP